MRLFLAALILSCGAFAQQTSPSPTSSAPGSSAPGMTDEDVAAIFSRLSQRAARIGPMLDQLHPNDWIAKGAPETYLAQWNSIREQFGAIQSDMSALAQHPDHLTESMKALFRVQATNQMLGSLMGGVRKYQNPALADLIESVAAEAGGDIDRFEKHLVELADEKEQQFTVVDREAQRCRASLSRQPAAPAGTNRKPQ
jgi:hypothetical protein